MITYDGVLENIQKIDKEYTSKKFNKLLIALFLFTSGTPLFTIVCISKLIALDILESYVVLLVVFCCFLLYLLSQLKDEDVFKTVVSWKSTMKFIGVVCLVAGVLLLSV